MSADVLLIRVPITFVRTGDAGFSWGFLFIFLLSGDEAVFVVDFVFVVVCDGFLLLLLLLLLPSSTVPLFFFNFFSLSLLICDRLIS